MGIVPPISTAGVGDEQGKGLGSPEERREEQGVDPDPGLDQTVEDQEPRRSSAAPCALDQTPRRVSEEGVARGQPPQKDGQHGSRGLGVRPEQRGDVLLPRHLVDEPAEPGEHRQQQRVESGHRLHSSFG